VERSPRRLLKAFGNPGGEAAVFFAVVFGEADPPNGGIILARSANES
jgi:hypothetical protein